MCSTLKLLKRELPSIILIQCYFIPGISLVCIRSGKGELGMFNASKFNLGGDVCRAISEAKNEFKNGNKSGELKPHEGIELSNIVFGKRGAYLLEYPVGKAQAGDPHPSGSRRLVLFIESECIRKIFFSEGHYARGTWYEITDW